MLRMMIRFVRLIGSITSNDDSSKNSQDSALMCPAAVPVLELGLKAKSTVDHSIPDSRSSHSTLTSFSHTHTSGNSIPARTNAATNIETTFIPPSTDIVIVGNGPAGILISLLLTGFVPYYHANPPQPHPDPILHRMLASSALSGSRPRSLLNQDFIQLTNHIQHQLAEAGRDANPISAMFDSLAHPQMDTHRGEYPSFLEWKHPLPQSKCTPPPTPSSDQPSTSNFLNINTARPHIVLGRGQVGGIWADLENDLTHTLSYQEHMELPIYSFADFLRDHPQYDEHLERPSRSSVSAYYKVYIQKVGIQSNFSNHTTVTGIYHLKDLDNHCCCFLDPTHQRSKRKDTALQNYSAKLKNCRICAPFRYAVMGYVELAPIDIANERNTNGKLKTRFLVRSKTVVLATGTFDQPKKLPAVSINPCSLPSSATLTIRETFHDTKQLEDWILHHNSPTMTQDNGFFLQDTSPMLSPHVTSSTLSSPSISASSISSPVLPMPLIPLTQPPPKYEDALPIVIVGTGLSAADAILLIQEKQPWRRIIHIFKHFTASEPSPLKRCHKDVYPEYASVWVRMRKSALLKNSVQLYPRGKEKDGKSNSNGDSSAGKGAGYCSIYQEKSRDDCPQCLKLNISEHSPICPDCAYKGLPDASISSWNSITGEIVIILSHEVVVRERVAAVGVFIGKQVSMGFLKGSLAQEMLSTGGTGGSIRPKGHLRGWSASRHRAGEQRGFSRRDTSDLSNDSLADIPTPPCTPPRSPTFRPTQQSIRKKQILQTPSHDVISCGISQSSVDMFGQQDRNHTKIDRSDMSAVAKERNEEEEEDVGVERVEEEKNIEGVDEQVDESHVLTLLKPLVSDMYNFRIIPAHVPVLDMEVQKSTPTTPTIAETSARMPLPAYPVKPKKCSRLPCYPIRHSITAVCNPPKLQRKLEQAQISTKEPDVAENTSELSGSTSSGTTGVVSLVEGRRSEDGLEEESLTRAVKRSSLGFITKSISSISMPCSPLLSCEITCPDLSQPPFLTLYSTAASAVSSAMTAFLPASMSFPSPPKMTVSASSSELSLKSHGVITAQASSDEDQSLENEEREKEGEEDEYNEEDTVEPLVDQSIYAAGAITGSKFVRYVLGNGIAIVADILKNEAVH